MLSFGAIMWNIHIFFLNEDSVEIEVKEMRLKEGIFHPSLTLCIYRETIHQHNVFTGHLSSNNQLQDKSGRVFY